MKLTKIVNLSPEKLRVNLDPDDANKNFDEEFIYQTFIKP